MTLQVNTHMGNYPIIIKRNALSRAGEHLKLVGRRVCIVTDTGVPAHYATVIADLCEYPVVFRFPEGEANKTMDTLQDLLRLLLKSGFDRADAIVAVGGGVVTDLAGFAASVYMRGIDFYNVPTTLLSQVDSSIGGKTAVNLSGVKNAIGAFYQPKAVLIDPDVLKTLPARQLSAGLAEAIKMAATCDAALFERMEREDLYAMLDDIIVGSLCIKRDVVEKDERETSLRRVLNFGHTLGHGYESAAELSGLLHGECVALGMLRLCSPAVRTRLIPLLEKAGLPTQSDLSADEVLSAVFHDKKADGSSIRYIYVEKIGEFCERREAINDFCRKLKETWQ